MIPNLEADITYQLREYCKYFSSLCNNSIFDLKDKSEFETQNANDCLRVSLMLKDDCSKFINKGYIPSEYGYKDQESLKNEVIKILRDRHKIEYKGCISESKAVSSITDELDFFL